MGEAAVSQHTLHGQKSVDTWLTPTMSMSGQQRDESRISKRQKLQFKASELFAIILNPQCLRFCGDLLDFVHNFTTA